MKYIFVSVGLLLGFQPSAGFASSSPANKAIKNLETINASIQTYHNKMRVVQAEMQKAIREWESLQRANHKLKQEIAYIDQHNRQRNHYRPQSGDR